MSGRAKGAAKGSCGETVVQKGVFGESVSSLPPYGFLLKYLKGPENLTRAEKKRTLQKHPFGQTVSPHDPFAAPLARPQNAMFWSKGPRKNSPKCEQKEKKTKVHGTSKNGHFLHLVDFWGFFLGFKNGILRTLNAPLGFRGFGAP